MQKWQKNFIIIFTGQVFSVLGSAAVQFSIVWWLTIKTESAIVLSIATIVAMLPQLVFGPFIGVIVDRINRKKIIIVADALVAISSVILGLVFLYNANPDLSIIYIILFIRGIGSTFHGPAMQAAIPLLAPKDKLTKVGGIGSLVNSLSNMLGPVLGAVLMGLFSIASIMLIDIFGALFAIFCLLFVKIPDVQQEVEKTHFIEDLKMGLGAIKANKVLMAVILPIIFINILSAPLGSLYPLLVKAHFAGDAFANSMVEVSFAFGILLSSLILGIWGGMKKRFLMMSIAVMFFGLSNSLIGILPASFWGFVWLVILSFISGLPVSFMNVPFMAYIQESIAGNMLGKVISLLLSVFAWSMPFGLIIAAPISEIIGVNSWLFLSGIVIVILSLWLRVRSKPYDEEVMMKVVDHNE
ncbi:MAG: MFS transporter [Erysipelotrichaceae bacterium]